MEERSNSPYVVFKTTDNKTIALDRKKAEDENPGILELYQITADRSANLKTAVGRKKKKGENLADLVSTDSNM